MVTGVKDTCPKPIYNYAQSMREMQIYAEGKDKKELQAILPFISSGRTIEDFTESNVAILDIDGTEPAETIWNESRGGWMAYYMPSIFFIQKSFSGKMHIGVRIPMVNDYATYKRYVGAVYEIFNERYADAFGCMKINDEYLDKNAAKATQLSFISANEISFFQAKEIDRDVIEKYANARSMDEIFGYLKKNNTGGVKIGVTVKDDKTTVTNEGIVPTEGTVTPLLSRDNNQCGVKFGVTVKESLPTPDEYNPKFDTTSKIHNFAKDVTTVIDTKEIIGKQHLDYTITSSNLECIKAGVIENYDTINSGRLLLNLNGMFEGIVDVKMKFYLRRDKKNGIIRLEQGQHRRLHLKRYIKQTILNAIAKENFDSKYDAYAIRDIIYTIKWLLANTIETKGKTRDIDNKCVKSCVKYVCENWDDVEVEYDTNRYICKPVEKITTFKELQKHWQFLRRKRYEAIDATFVYFVDALKLSGKSYSEIAQALNDNNVEAKTDRGWTYESIRAYKAQISSVSDYSVRLDELLEKGEKYADIASKLNEEGYLTKTGCPFTKDSIKNYVKRKLKK